MAHLIPRPALLRRLQAGLRRAPVTALLGPRQSGKTTLAREVLRGRSLDEVQQRPDLLPVLRGLADRGPPPARFLLLGSASPSLARGVSETLAGRIHFTMHVVLRDLAARRLPRLTREGGWPDKF